MKKKKKTQLKSIGTFPASNTQQSLTERNERIKRGSTTLIFSQTPLLFTHPTHQSPRSPSFHLTTHPLAPFIAKITLRKPHQPAWTLSSRPNDPLCAIKESRGKKNAPLLVYGRARQCLRLYGERERVVGSR